LAAQGAAFYCVINKPNTAFMKKTFLLVAGSLVILASCTSKKEGGMSDTAKKNLESARKIANAFQTGDPSVVDSVVAEDFVDHGPKGDTNRDTLKSMISMTKGMNVKMEMLNEQADDQYVYQWMRFSGNNDGKMMEMPAGPFEFTEIQLVRYKDGKAVEHWAFMEPREMMKMMPPQGAANMPPPPAKKDTVK
jgi:hypothetical protein